MLASHGHGGLRLAVARRHFPLFVLLVRGCRQSGTDLLNLPTQLLSLDLVLAADVDDSLQELGQLFHGKRLDVRHADERQIDLGRFRGVANHRRDLLRSQRTTARIGQAGRERLAKTRDSLLLRLDFLARGVRRFLLSPLDRREMSRSRIRSRFAIDS